MKRMLNCVIATFILTGFCSNMAFATPVPKKKHNSSRVTMASPAEANYDMKHLTFHINITDTSTHIYGDVMTWAVSTIDSMTNYVFELDSSMTLDSAKFNGVAVSVSRVGNVRTIALTRPLAAGTYFTADIAYHGTPTASGGFFNALTNATSSHGTHVTYSLSDPYAAKNWWPAKQDLDDKIDTVDMFVTVPAGVRDGSNGVLLNIDSATHPGYWQFHWQTKYPILYYLISISAARYVQFDSYMHFTGSTDSMLIQNFFYDTATFDPEYLAEYDSIGVIINFYDSLYGRYPFWKEKYGMCYSELPGGMEHQTMTTIGNPYSTFTPWTWIIAHELCHQWFGDHVSFQDWGDVWLSEGFATFSEQLFLSRFWGEAAGRAHRKMYLSQALANYCGSVFVTDTSTATTLFSPYLVYAKGQGVVTMLRYAAPADSLFFKVLQAYQNEYAYSNAKTADLQRITDSIYGVSMDTFFNEWIYGQGYPKYKLYWNQVGTIVYVRVVQTTSCPLSTPLFHTFLELDLHSATTDTIVKIYNSADTQLFTFNWAQTMDSLISNPDVMTICAFQSCVKDVSLPLGVVTPSEQGLSVYPNPAKSHWQIDNLTDGTLLQLMDYSGRIIWSETAGKSKISIPAKSITSGDYLLKVTQNTGIQYIKLTKQ